ncbi:uncharacterized protein DUF1648 [Brevibacterium sanguinis]|uniref:Uncharacterized protein DUF1648 n=2 Tax=Brevibacterium TaxID=1696 RepID=A0A366IMR2_9MICO|nr:MULTISPECIES: DUF1648 domain-containing protein [Brevibacterium]RBP68210.1 uncharacterized protein DUF1648 [Brevibacterium sanguinis]RBP74373.1 uncharacterized protein DUF1648 [Brevibacterium celere]
MSPRRSRPTGPFSRGDLLARLFVGVATVVFIGTALWFAAVAPDEVPSHFDGAGRADEWSSKAETLAWLVPLGVGLPIVLSIRAIWARIPLTLLNVPNKEYWVEHGERDYLIDRVMVFLRTTGGAMALLFTTILLISLDVARTGSDALVLLPTLGFLAITVAAIWVLFRSLDPRRRT